MTGVYFVTLACTLLRSFCGNIFISPEVQKKHTFLARLFYCSKLTLFFLICKNVSFSAQWISVSPAPDQCELDVKVLLQWMPCPVTAVVRGCLAHTSGRPCCPETRVRPSGVAPSRRLWTAPAPPYPLQVRLGQCSCVQIYVVVMVFLSN